uniref:Uncharacterized protein n=1 Tax=Anguilla anguilla TaxID=7936 RepID=A0A0E9TA92_ANGAN
MPANMRTAQRPVVSAKVLEPLNHATKTPASVPRG